MTHINVLFRDVHREMFQNSTPLTNPHLTKEQPIMQLRLLDISTYAHDHKMITSQNILYKIIHVLFVNI
jgi:hypothetical protein